VERFEEWTHAAATPDDAVDRDQLLTNVMLYWLTRTADSAAQMHYENMHAGPPSQQASATPTGIAVFAGDYAIRRYGERGHNIVHWTEFDRGGHFAAMEVPERWSATCGRSSGPSGNSPRSRPGRGENGRLEYRTIGGNARHPASERRTIGRRRGEHHFQRGIGSAKFWRH
jgi:hypothetical protein